MGKWFQNKSFSTEKQEQGIKARKGHRGINARKIHRDIKARKMHRAFGVLLAAALVFQAVPFEGIAVSASESSGGGLCEHHRSHTPDCGYKEAEPGHGCTHEHTEDCYRTVEGEDGSATKEPDCHHEHDESCGYREAAEGSPCTFVCEICSGGTDKIPEDKTDDNGINDGDSENPGTENGDETEEPDEGQEECTCEERCTEDSINTDCPVCGAEDASLSDCKGKDTEDSTEDAEENTKQPEDTGICKHHQEHDDACGYQPESEDSEGSSCTYECRICPIEALIAALPGDVTEDNADEVRAQLDEILALFSELTEEEQEQIDLSRVYELQGALDGANDPDPVADSVDYREASWNNSEVVYADKTATCTSVESSADAVTWNAGWYAVSGTVTIAEPITVSGDVNLILADGCTLNASQGIVVTTNNSLTIYAQTSGTGTLNATGTTDSSKNASAGIGGSIASVDSGAITIHGGVINATGGSTGFWGYGGAGIGGGTLKAGNGGNSGAIIIYGGTITANSGEGDMTGAGIGGGASGNDGNGGAGSNITIYGGSVIASSTGTGTGGAGIGGGGGLTSGGAGNNIQICGGTINATGNSKGAGIGGGGGGSDCTSGDGTVTISGGTVTTVGGKYAAGIGGGGGYQGSYTSVTGGAGTVNITGGIVDASSPTDVYWSDYTGAPIGNGGNTSVAATVNKTTGIVFENGAGTVCGNAVLNESYAVPAGYSLNIPAGASLSGSGTLTGGGTFTTENLTEDMISVPKDLSYTGEDLTETIENKVTLNGEVTICGQTFTASTDGWDLSVEKVSDLEYTVKYTHADKELLKKDVIIAPKSIGEAAVSITGPFTYNTEAHTPDPAVILDGKTLVKDTDYTVAYANNINAGGATITVTGKGNYVGTVEKTFTIEKATPTLAWENTTQELIYTGNEARITAPKATGPNGIQLGITHDTGSCQFSYKAQGDSGFTDGLPINAGTYTIRACIEAKGNYAAADSTNELTLTIQRAEQNAPAAPAATEDNIKDTSITLTAVKNAEYSLDGTNWRDSPVFTGLEANKAYTFHIRLKADKNHNASPGSTASITTKKTTLNGASVTVSGSYTYTGAAVVPEAGNVTVILNGTTVDSGQYTISATDNINAGMATVTVTATEGGKYSGSASTAFLIGKAALTIRANDQSIICGDSITEGTGQVTYSGLCGGDTLNSITLTASTTDVPGGDITPSAAQIQNASGMDATANYDITYQTGTLTVSYMQPPANIRYNGGAAKEWYSGDVEITAVDYTVSDTLGGKYEAFYTISAQEGTVAKTLYFKDADGHMSAGVEVTVKFDLTPSTGEIAVGEKWWQKVLNFVSFGHYAAKAYTVTIKAEDAGGSGIGGIEYAIVTGESQYTEKGALEAAVTAGKVSWTAYADSSRPTVPVDTSQYVVYARLTDKAGNVTYISTDGILLDDTPPVVDSLSVPEDTRKDVTAGFTFTVSEAADYYYVVLPQGSTDPSAEDIIVTCGGKLPDGKTGNVIAGAAIHGSGAVSPDMPAGSVSVGVEPNTAYTVYVTAADRAVDISSSADGKPAGNIGNVAKADFTTKKTLPVIKELPKISGTYGQTIGEMALTGGAAADSAGAAVAGTWAVSSADKGRKPSAGTAEKVTVTFTPDNGSFDSISVKVVLTVGQRSLTAPEVTVSEVAGTYTYTGTEIKPEVAVSAGNPVSGIFISDTGAALTTNDFTVSYSNHTDAGVNTASVTITGQGNYTGSVTKYFIIKKAPGREVPALSGSYTDDGQTYTYTIMPMEGAVYRMGDDGTWTEPEQNGGNVFEGITPGTKVTFYAKIPGDKNHEEGAEKKIEVSFPKLTPAAPALSYSRKTAEGSGEITVTITLVSGAQYSFDGGQTWTDKNEQGGFTASQTVALAVRLKETATHNQSPEQTLTIDLAKGDREAPPAFTLSVEANGEADYTVTIPATEGCEYSFDGETWSDVNAKTGVKPGETVTGYKRYKETSDYNASSAVSASKTMEKFTVKTPVISPAGGSYEGSVSVAITCASEGAEIYYTTDGSTPGRGSTRYTGAFTVTAPATVKAVAVKDGLTDSAVATAAYTKKSSGGSGSGGNGGTGGNSGGKEDNGTTGENGGTEPGNGDNGGQDSGSTNPGNGTITPQIPVNPSTGTGIAPGNGAAPGTGTTPANSGNRNAAKPGSNRSSGAGTSVQGTKQPFIKDADGKIGWDVIRAEEEKAQEGSVINVDMNGSVVVPGDIFDSIRGKDITITFDMGNGILWSVDGKSITTDKAGDIDFSVKKGVNTVPVDIVNNVTGESYSIQISLAYEGEFGFTAVLSINLGKENAGYTASLYYYNESTGELEFICKDQIAQDGTASLVFTHASGYVIVVDGGEDGSTGETKAAAQEDGNAPEAPEGEGGGTAAGLKDAGEGKEPGALLPAMAAIIIILAAGMAGALAVKRKKEEREKGAQ